MDGIELLLVLLAIAAILSGPIALIVAIGALKRIEGMRRELSEARMRPPVRTPEPPSPPVAPVLYP